MLEESVTKANNNDNKEEKFNHINGQSTDEKINNLITKFYPALVVTQNNNTEEGKYQFSPEKSLKIFNNSHNAKKYFNKNFGRTLKTKQKKNAQNCYHTIDQSQLQNLSQLEISSRNIFQKQFTNNSSLQNQQTKKIQTFFYLSKYKEFQNHLKTKDIERKKNGSQQFISQTKFKQQQDLNNLKRKQEVIWMNNSNIFHKQSSIYKIKIAPKNKLKEMEESFKEILKQKRRNLHKVVITMNSKDSKNQLSQKLFLTSHKQFHSQKKLSNKQHQFGKKNKFVVGKVKRQDQRNKDFHQTLVFSSKRHKSMEKQHHQTEIMMPLQNTMYSSRDLNQFHKKTLMEFQKVKKHSIKYQKNGNQIKSEISSKKNTFPSSFDRSVNTHFQKYQHKQQCFYQNRKTHFLKGKIINFSFIQNK